MLGYEETGFLLGVGDRVRAERRAAQQVVDQVAAERDDWARVAWSNKSIADQNLEVAEANRVVAENAAAEVRRLLQASAVERAARETAERRAAELQAQIAALTAALQTERQGREAAIAVGEESRLTVIRMKQHQFVRAARGA